ncbi:MAG: glycosyltransferase family 39 protein [Myxococcota bacterium]
MPRTTLPLLAAFAVAALLRLHDAWSAPPLSGFDGPYHAAYLGAIVWDGRFPLPRGFTNHPPLYYAVAAAVWKLVAPVAGTHGQLFAMRLVSVASGLAMAVAVGACARLVAPARSRVAVYAAVLALFVPMHVGPSSVLGNQAFSDALAALATFLLLRALAREHDGDALRAAAIAGIAAGLGVLAKLSVGVVVAAGAAALLADGVRRVGARPRAAALAAAFACVAALVASPHFVRNAVHADAPPDATADVWAGLDRSQGLAARPWSAYVDPHLGSLVRPGTTDPAARRAVWPNTFASTWFDLFGSVVDVHAPRAQRAAHVLFAFGALFTAAALAGAALAARGAVSGGPPLGTALLALVAAATLASYVAFTRAVATQGALKGTYLAPALAAFCTFAALGLDALAARSAAARRAVAVALGAFAVCVCATLAHGGIAPLRANPADFVMRDFADAGSRRAYEYFTGRPAPTGANPLRLERAPSGRAAR